MHTISENTLRARINRVLAHDGLRLAKVREDSRDAEHRGQWYCLDLARNAVIEWDVDLETLGREIGALHIHNEVVPC